MLVELSLCPQCLYTYKQAKNVGLSLDTIIHVVGSKFSCCNCTVVNRNTCRCNKAKTFSCEAYREYKFAFFACCASDNSPLHYTPKAIQVTSLVPTLSFAYTDIVKLLVVKFCMPQLGTALPTLDVFVPTQANTLVNGILNSTLVVLVCTNPHCYAPIASHNLLPSYLLQYLKDLVSFISYVGFS